MKEVIKSIGKMVFNVLCIGVGILHVVFGIRAFDNETGYTDRNGGY